MKYLRIFRKEEKPQQTQSYKTTTWLFHQLVTWLWRSCVVVGKVYCVFFLFLMYRKRVSTLDNEMKINFYLSSKKNISLYFLEHCQFSIYVVVRVDYNNSHYILYQILVTLKCFDWTILTWYNGKLVAWLFLNNILKVKYGEVHRKTLETK